MSETIPEDRVRVFDRAGIEIASFMASVSRSWAIGKEGRASFDYPSRKTDVVNEDVLRFGNYLLVENSVLPAWVGIIYTPREWDDKSVTVNAFTMERMFSFRRGSNGEEKISGSAGTIFRQMVDRINLWEKTIMINGHVWTGGDQRQETLLPQTMDKNLKQLQERSREEYSFTTAIIKRRLAIYANWLKTLGVTTQFTLYQAAGGGNVEEPKMKEDDEIINDVFGYGEGSTWTVRPKYTNVDAASIATYGLMQASKNYNDVSNVSTIYWNNIALLGSKSQPRRIFQLNALNVGDTFEFMDLGNVIRFVSDKIGFTGGSIGTDTNVRILGMSYDPKVRNKIRLVLEEL